MTSSRRKSWYERHKDAVTAVIAALGVVVAACVTAWAARANKSESTDPRSITLPAPSTAPPSARQNTRANWAGRTGSFPRDASRDGGPVFVAVEASVDSALAKARADEDEMSPTSCREFRKIRDSLPPEILEWIDPSIVDRADSVFRHAHSRADYTFSAHLYDSAFRRIGHR